MGVYNVNTCKNYPGDDCLLISGVLGGQLLRGGGFHLPRGQKLEKRGFSRRWKSWKFWKKWKTRGFRSAENLENFEKIEKKGFFAAPKYSKISKKLKKEGLKVSKISKKLEKGGFRGMALFEKSNTKGA